MKLLNEYERGQIAELMQILEINIKILDKDQYRIIETEISRKIGELKNEAIKL